MTRTRYEVTAQQGRELVQAYRHETDGPTKTRYQAVRLYIEGYAVPEIGEITGCNRTSLMEWNQKYRQRGIEGLRDHRGGRQRAKLSLEQIEEVRDKLHQYSPRDLFGDQTHTSSGQHWTVEDLSRAVERWYGVRWQTRGSYHRLFTQCGFSFQRAEKVYKSRRDPDVMEFEAMVEKK
jgi:transposase